MTTAGRAPGAAQDPGPPEEVLRGYDPFARAALAPFGFSPGARRTLLSLSENATYQIDDPADGQEEKNLDASVTIILDAMGIDISQRPKAPTALRAFAKAGGTIRVEWAYNTINPSPVPTGFHIYRGTGGSPSYASPVATVNFAAAIAKIPVPVPMSSG